MCCTPNGTSAAPGPLGERPKKDGSLASSRTLATVSAKYLNTNRKAMGRWCCRRPAGQHRADVPGNDHRRRPSTLRDAPRRQAPAADAGKSHATPRGRLRRGGQRLWRGTGRRGHAGSTGFALSACGTRVPAAFSRGAGGSAAGQRHRPLRETVAAAVKPPAPDRRQAGRMGMAQAPVDLASLTTPVGVGETHQNATVKVYIYRFGIIHCLKRGRIADPFACLEGHSDGKTRDRGAWAISVRFKRMTL